VKTETKYATSHHAEDSSGCCVSQPVDDDGIVSGVKDLDADAFRVLVERFAPRICQVAFGITGNAAAADEIAREVFVQVYFAIPDLAARTPLYPWLHRIAVRECYGHLLRQRSMTIAAFSAADSDRVATQKEFINWLLGKIPEEDRWLLIAKDVEGLSLSELSSITGLNERTIKSRLFHLRHTLIETAGKSRPAADPGVV
jgi:RNA polymerase sigma-70 factor (ECF subfamily)